MPVHRTNPDGVAVAKDRADVHRPASTGADSVPDVPSRSTLSPVMLKSIQRTAGNRAASALVTRPLQRQPGDGGQAKPKGTSSQSLNALAPEVRGYATSVQDYYANMAKIWEDSAAGGGPKYTGPFGRANLGTSVDKEIKQTLGEIFGNGSFDVRVGTGSGVEVDIFGSQFPIDIELKLTISAKRSSQTIRLLKAAEENQRLLLVVYSNSPVEVYNFLPKNALSRSHLRALQDATSRIQGKLQASMGSAGRQVAKSTTPADDAAGGTKVPGGIDAAVPAAKVVVRNERRALRIRVEAGEVGGAILKGVKFAGEVTFLYDVARRAYKAGQYVGDGEYGKAFDQIPLLLWDQVEGLVDLLPSMGNAPKPITFPIEVEPVNPYPTGAQWGDPTVQ
jgi:hypothetical protein